MGTFQTSLSFIFMVMYVLSQSRINNGFVSSHNLGRRERGKEIAVVVVESALFCRRRKNESKIPLLLPNLIFQSAPRKIYYLFPTKKHGSFGSMGYFNAPAPNLIISFSIKSVLYEIPSSCRLQFVPDSDLALQLEFFYRLHSTAPTNAFTYVSRYSFDIRVFVAMLCDGIANFGRQENFRCLFCLDGNRFRGDII